MLQVLELMCQLNKACSSWTFMAHSLAMVKGGEGYKSGQSGQEIVGAGRGIRTPME